MLNNLKDVLLSTGAVTDNEYLDKYVKLIMDNAHTERLLHCTNEHHIVPQYCYKYNNNIDECYRNELVNLLYTDHIFAHYLLALCSSNNMYKAFNVHSIRFLLNGKSLEDVDFTNVDVEELQKIYEEGRQFTFEASHSIEACKKVSNSLIGRVSPNKGNFKKKPTDVKKSKKNPNPKNKKLSDIASARTGEKNPFFGKKHTDATKRLIGAMKGYPVGMFDVFTGEKLMEFCSASDAARYLYENGFIKTQKGDNRILTVCKEGNPTHKAYGYNWRFIGKSVTTIGDECSQVE